ncbi:MAG: ATP synthase F0 subunit B [Deltaproteobacteria bacterium]|nr:ATP synthase F0 subunit B [Deltaproteobacteria bacterium]
MPFSGLTLDLDITFVLVLVLLLVPLLALNALVFKPFLAMFEERHDRVKGALERAEDRLEEAEARAKAFDEKVQVATSKGLDARSKIRDEATKAMHARIGTEREKLDKQLEKALEEIKFSKDAALRDAAAESRQLAEIAAKKLLGRGA